MTQKSEIFERLTFQVNAFQEGFEILSKSKTLQILGKNFCHILRGSLMVSYVNLYYKAPDLPEFTTVHEQKKSVRPDLSIYTLEQSFKYYPQENGKSLLAYIPRKNGSGFIIQVGPGLSQQNFTEYEMISLQLFVQLLDNACQTLFLRKSEKDLIFSLNHRLLQMNNLIDTGIDLSKCYNVKEVLTLVLARAVSITNAARGSITVKKGNKIIDRLYFPSGYSVRTSGKQREYQVELKGSFKFQGKRYVMELYDKESRKGMALFDDTDQLLLDALIRQTNAALESEYLTQQALEMEKVKRELAIAATIQQRILPENLPEISGYDLAGINIPAIEVCGDYYDSMQMPDNRYALIMADVSGKGIPAALLVSSLQASLRVYLEGGIAITSLAEKLNKLIYNSTTAEKYLTMCICFLNVETGEIEALNAGHNPPLILRNDKTLEKIGAGGIPIGMADFGLTYTKQNITLQKGESLLFFTDGITEAMDNREEMYEDDRLESFFIENQCKTAREFVDDLIRDVNEFVGRAPQSDDITVLYLKRNA